MLNKNIFVCYLGTARFKMSLTIHFVAFKRPSVLGAIISTSLSVSHHNWLLKQILLAFGVFTSKLYIFDRSGKTADSKKLIFVTVSNMTFLV